MNSLKAAKTAQRQKFPLRTWWGVLLLGLFALAGCEVGEDPPTSSMGDSNSWTNVAVPDVKLPPECAGAIVPTLETIKDGTYTPLSRPLFVYVNKKSLKRPEVAGYLHFLLHEGQPLVPLVRFFPLSPATLEESQKRLDQELHGVDLTGKLKGTVIVDGSSTVYPVAAAASEQFMEAHRFVNIPVGKSGTGAGFKKFTIGETDISTASRPISTKEIEACQKHKVDYLELQVAIDGLAVVVNTSNSFCSCLTVEELKRIWEPNSKVKTWKQVREEWPNQPIKLYGADTDSGTFDYFTEVINGKAKASRTDYTSSAEDNVLVKGVEGDEFSLGYFGYAYYADNASRLKVLGIKPGTAKTHSSKEAKPK